jgi:hypothetical protein
MAGELVRAVLRPLSLAQIRRISPVRFGAAGGDVARIYREMEREFGVLAPTVALHSPAPDTMAAAWLILREGLLVPGLVDRTAKEAVATAVSVGNTCPYCVNVHQSMVYSLTRGPDAAAIAGDHVEEIADPHLRALTVWARANATPDGAAGQQAPFPAEHATEFAAVVVLFQYYNRMVNVFLGEAPLPPGAPTMALTVVNPVLSRLMRSAAGNMAGPGASLDLLPAAPLPPDLQWAAGNPDIAEAFARAGAAVDAAGRRSVPDPVRELVLAELAEWDGRPKGPSRAWVEQAIAVLAEDERPAGRLALLTALASYQVDSKAVDAFRAGQPEDAELVELVAWASLAAARRVGGWIRTGETRVDERVAAD